MDRAIGAERRDELYRQGLVATDDEASPTPKPRSVAGSTPALRDECFGTNTIS